MKELAIRTNARKGLIDITDRLADEVPAALRKKRSATFTPPPRHFRLDFPAFPAREG